MENLLENITHSIESTTVELRKGESLELDECQRGSIAFIASGSLVLTLNERAILIREENLLADPHLLFYDKSSSMYSMIAFSDVKLMLFDKERLESYISDKPKLLSLYRNELLNELKVLDSMRRIMKESSGTKRLLLIILLYLRSSYSRPNKYILESNIQWLADISNVSIRFAKRVLNKMVRRGVLKIESGTMVVSDLEALKLLSRKEEFL